MTLTSLAALVIALASRRRDADWQQRLFLLVNYAACALLWIGWQTIGQTALDWDYFAYPLMLPFTAALAALPAGRAVRDTGPWGMTVYRLVLAVAGLGPWFFAYPIQAWVSRLALSPMVGVAAVALTVGLLLTFLPRSRLTFAAGAFALGITSMAVTVRPEDFMATTCRTPRAAQRVIEKAHSYLHSVEPDYEKVRVWFDSDASFAAPGTCNAGRDTLRNGGHTLVATGFKYFAQPWEYDRLESVPDQEFQAAAADQVTIVYITADPARVEAMRTRFAGLGIDTVPGPAQAFHKGSLTLPLSILTFPAPPAESSAE